MTHSRTAAADGGWVLAFEIFAFFGSRGANENAAPGVRLLDPFGWLVALMAPLLLLFARRYPRAVLAAATVLVAAYLLRDYAGGPIYLVVVAAAAILGFVRDLQRSWPPVVASATILATAAAVQQGRDAVIAAVFVVMPWAVAALVRMHRSSIRQADAERERHARDAERVRIAREVHDVVGHSLAVISMQAGVALHVERRRPEQAHVALDAIARTSADALGELRRTLAVLRGEAASTDEPGLSDLPELVDGFVSGGQDIRLDLRSDTRATGGPAAGVAHEAAVYRIVQESLTNTARHGGAAPAVVVVERTERSLVVDVHDRGPAPALADTPALAGTPAPAGTSAGTGTGIGGMRDRCRALGGTLRAGPHPAGGWHVRAELPLAP